MSKTRGMTRRQKMMYEAKQRRLNGTSKLKISMEAFKPENMYSTEQEEYESWEEAGVLDNVRNTLDFGDEDGNW